jgi:hypothetical protein
MQTLSQVACQNDREIPHRLSDSLSGDYRTGEKGEGELSGEFVLVSGLGFWKPGKAELVLLDLLVERAS